MTLEIPLWQQLEDIVKNLVMSEEKLGKPVLYKFIKRVENKE